MTSRKSHSKRIRCGWGAVSNFEGCISSQLRNLVIVYTNSLLCSCWDVGAWVAVDAEKKMIFYVFCYITKR